MNLLQRISAGLQAFRKAGDAPISVEPLPLPPEASRFVNVEDSQIFYLPKYQFDWWGQTDPVVPTTREMRKYMRGLFSALVEVRADSFSRAVLGSRGIEGWTTQRYNPGKGEFEETEKDHPWNRLVHNPCPHMSAFDFWNWVSMSRDMMGQADVVVEHDRLGLPVAFYPVYREFGLMNPVSDGSGGIERWVFLRQDGERIELAKRDVIRFGRFSSWTPYETVSLIEKAILELDTDLYQALYRQNIAKTGHTPPLILTTEQRLTQEEAEQAGKRFLQKYQTAGEVKGVPILGQGVTPHKMGMKADDLAAIDSQALTDKHLFWITRVPQGLLTDEANRANAEQAERTFAVYYVQPESERLSSMLTKELTDQFMAEGLKVMAGNAVPVDRKEEAEIDRILLGAGRTMNEIRSKYGLDPVPGGDVVLVRRDMMPLTQMLEEAQEEMDPSANPDMVAEAVKNSPRLQKRFKALQENFMSV